MASGAGAAELEVDLAGARSSGQRVSAWIRLPGSAGPFSPWLRQAGAPAARSHGTTIEAEFDCAARSLRVLAAQGLDAQGRISFLWSSAGSARPLGDGAQPALEHLHDAMCELARARRRAD